jgi:hypothetical protein
MALPRKHFVGRKDILPGHTKPAGGSYAAGLLPVGQPWHWWVNRYRQLSHYAICFAFYANNVEKITSFLALRPFMTDVHSFPLFAYCLHLFAYISCKSLYTFQPSQSEPSHSCSVLWFTSKHCLTHPCSIHCNYVPQPLWLSPFHICYEVRAVCIYLQSF